MAPVTAYPRDESPFGVLGLSGNADTWCADEDEVPGLGEVRAIRGGVWHFDVEEAGRLAGRTFARPTERFEDTGLRCVVDAPGARPRGATPPPATAPEPPAASDGPVVRVAGWVPEPLRRRSAALGRRLGATFAIEPASGDDLLARARAGEVDLAVTTLDVAASLIDAGLSRACEPAAEGDLLPPFRRPPELQVAGRAHGQPFAFGVLRPLSAGQEVATWGDLWELAPGRRLLLWDDAVHLVTLACASLGLDPAYDLARPEAAREVRTRLAELLAAGATTWSTPEEAAALLATDPSCVTVDWGPVERTSGRRAEPAPDAPLLWVGVVVLLRAGDDATAAAARRWVDEALAPEAQRDLHVEGGLLPTSARAVPLLDKRSARRLAAELPELCEAAEGVHVVPDRAECRRLLRAARLLAPAFVPGRR